MGGQAPTPARCLFQSTHSQGVRCQLEFSTPHRKEFQSTHSQGVRFTKLGGYQDE